MRVLCSENLGNAAPGGHSQHVDRRTELADGLGVANREVTQRQALRQSGPMVEDHQPTPISHPSNRNEHIADQSILLDPDVQ